jgi:hypothetical protein
VSDCTGNFTLFTTDAALWMDKDSFHIQPTSFNYLIKQGNGLVPLLFTEGSLNRETVITDKFLLYLTSFLKFNHRAGLLPHVF